MFFTSNIKEFVQQTSLPERFNLNPFSYKTRIASAVYESHPDQLTMSQQPGAGVLRVQHCLRRDPRRRRHCQYPPRLRLLAALEATQGQNDSFFSQIPYKCYLEEVASVGD